MKLPPYNPDPPLSQVTDTPPTLPYTFPTHPVAPQAPQLPQYPPLSPNSSNSAHLPASLSHNISAELYANLGRQAGAHVMACFEKLGGGDAFAQWAKNNPTDFYTKLFPKMISSTKAIEINAAGTDDALAILEADFTATNNQD